MILQTEILSTVDLASDFLKQMIILESFNSDFINDLEILERKATLKINHLLFVYR